MGSKHSKGGVRAELQCIVPLKWSDLEQLHLRYQQEAHRRSRTDPQCQYFLSFNVFRAILTPVCAAASIDKAQLLATFDLLDRRQKRKLVAMDFFSGLALIVEAKKSAKFEFILSLLDNGGLKTVNKCELMMVLMASVRGLTMFKWVPEVREELMRPLAKRYCDYS
uniref:EF-hand domain-containing protein n=1 Tax=Globisporangium ultimum (strain ATCC 200006 / CBS 805.95 / DAOM BR144) TaxID=431595 RepID=K3X3Z5_GLOUD